MKGVSRIPSALRPRAFAAGLLAASIGLTGCVILPFPPFRKVAEGTEIGADDLTWLRTGETRRAEVLAHLGPPDVDFVDQRTIAYAWSGIRAEIFFGAAGRTGSGGSVPMMMRRALMVRFDAAGQVVAFSIVDRPISGVPYGAVDPSPDTPVMDWRAVLDRWLAVDVRKPGKPDPDQKTDQAR